MDVKRQVAAQFCNCLFPTRIRMLLTFILAQTLCTLSLCTLANAQFSGGQFQPTQSWNQGSTFTESNYQPKTQNDTTFAGNKTAKIKWIDGKNIAEAFRLAAQQNKPLMLHFWNERCQPCMSLEQFVFPNPILAEAINSQFIPVKVNTLETPTIHKKYGVNRLPWDVFVSPSGQKLRDVASERSATKYTKVVNSIAKIYGGILNVGRTNQTGGNTSVQNPVPTNHPVVQPTATQSAQMNASNSFGQSANTPTGSSAKDIAFKSKANSSHVQNKFFSEPKPTVQPNNLPPIGMEGFCPVSMLRDTKKIAGSKDWGCIHRGKLYFFANQVYRDIFMKDPDRYAPVLAGFDIVVYRETGKLVEGKTEYGGFVGQPENRVVFLFSTAENKKKFIADKQGRYLESARIATKNTGENWLR